jgi:hypothetical protein
MPEEPKKHHPHINNQGLQDRGYKPRKLDCSPHCSCCHLWNIRKRLKTSRRGLYFGCRRTFLLHDCIGMQTEGNPKKKKYQYDDLDCMDNTCHPFTKDDTMTSTARYALCNSIARTGRDRSRGSRERVCRGCAGKDKKSNETCELNSKLVAPFHYWQQGSRGTFIAKVIKNVSVGERNVVQLLLS